MAYRASDLRRRVIELGFEWHPGKGTSHFKIKGPGLARPVPVSCHNGLRQEISDHLLKQIAKQLGLADWETLKR